MNLRRLLQSTRARANRGPSYYIARRYGMIFVLNVRHIASHSFNVEGIINCFYIRYKRVGQDEDMRYESLEDSFSTLCPFSLPYNVLLSIRCVQNCLKKIMNNCRLAQVLKGSNKIEGFAPIAWRYWREELLS